MNFDVAVIGGGPGGYVAAVRAAQLGLKVAVIEKEHMGGTCLNKGCIPTKALLQAAKVNHVVNSAEDFGINAHTDLINFTRIVERTKQVVDGLNKSVTNLMGRHKIVVIKGEASFLESNKLLVNNKEEIEANNIIIATGALPRMLPGINQSLIDDNLIWTSKEAMFASELPKKMLIVGTGAIGIEFASFYNALGTKVTVVEIQDRILIQEDEEIASMAKRFFEKQGIKFVLGTSISEFSKHDNKLSVTLSNGTTDVFDVGLIAIGVIPNTQNLHLDKIGVRVEKNGSIVVNEYMETSVKGVYAIGDVANAPCLAHKASKEGIICAEKIANVASTQSLNYKCVPSCVYSYPQIASVGITEQEAKQQGIQIKIGRSCFKGNGKALAVGESDGLVKVIFDAKTGELLGAHMIGYEVTELIPIFSLAIASELTEKELIMAIFPHPTMSECLQEAVMQAFDMGIHS